MKLGKKKNKTNKSSVGDLSKFMYSTDVDKMSDDANNVDNSLVKNDIAFIVEGENVFLVLPGTAETNGDTMVDRMLHDNYDLTPCARKNNTERFEKCYGCDEQFKHRTPKSEKVEGEDSKNPYDGYYMRHRGISGVANITPFCEHEVSRDKKTKNMVERVSSSNIDPDRVEQCPCFMDESVFKQDSKKCKNCIAYYSCFQGPQFISFANKTAIELLDKQKRLGDKKFITLGGKKIKLRGNISLAWWLLYKKVEDKPKSIAKHISFPLIVTKKKDPKLPAKFGVSYSYDFSRQSFIIPEKWQMNILKRAKNLADFRTTCTYEESKTYLEEYLKKAEQWGKKDAAGSSGGKPKCFDKKKVKDGEDCTGPGCPVYDDCCKGKKKSKKDKDKKNTNKKKTKQDEAMDRIGDEDDEDDDIIARLKKKAKKNK